jgi:hypothetical protein
MAIYDLYYFKEGYFPMYLVSGPRGNFMAYLNEASIVNTIKYVNNMSPHMSYIDTLPEHKLATFTTYEDLITNYPELLL